jgi:hypothetical protein
MGRMGAYQRLPIESRRPEDVAMKEGLLQMFGAFLLRLLVASVGDSLSY